MYNVCRIFLILIINWYSVKNSFNYFFTLHIDAYNKIKNLILQKVTTVLSDGQKLQMWLPKFATGLQIIDFFI